MADRRLAWVHEDIEVVRGPALRDVTVPVPSGPRWSVADLIGHVGDVLAGRWTDTLSWSAVDEGNPVQLFTGHSSAVAKDHTDLVGFFARFATEWLIMAERTDPAKPTWTFNGPGRADLLFGRTSTECALHRRDAEGEW